MRGNSLFVRWLTAAFALAVAECASAPDVQAQSSGEFPRLSHFRSGKYHESLFGPLSWEPQRRKAHRRSETARTSGRLKAKSAPALSEQPAAVKKEVKTPIPSTESVPLPRPRPAFWLEPHTFAEAAG